MRDRAALAALVSSEDSRGVGRIPRALHDTLVRRGLLRSDWSLWKEYRRARGTTSHTYDEEKAREVFAIVPDFLAEARFLRDRLREGLA
mgnify:CR=1 FL=1